MREWLLFVQFTLLVAPPASPVGIMISVGLLSESCMMH
jgi:hypothetical protein